MTNQILCAVEPNEEAKGIMKTAAALAAARGETLNVLHVVKPLVHVYGDLNFTPLIEAEASMECAARQEALDFLKGAAEEVGVEAEIEVRRGYPATEISRTAADGNVDLIVIGVHNRHGLSRLLGSTTRAVLNATDCSVLAVHPDGEAKDYANVLVAVDTSKSMPEVLAHASQLATDAKETHVVSVVVPVGAALAGMSPESFSSRWPLQSIQSDIVEKVRTNISDAMHEAGIDQHALEIREGDPSERIVEYANELGTDLLVVGAGRRNVLDRLLLGSTTQAVLNHAPCDVFVGR